jgi:hypothetical protein
MDLGEHVERHFVVVCGCVEDVGAGAAEVAEDGACLGSEEEESGMERPITNRFGQPQCLVA